MAEGGFDEIEMNERESEQEVRYEYLDNDSLNNEYDSLEDRLVKNPNDSITKDKMKFINNLWGSDDIDGTSRYRQRNTREGGQMETDFGGKEIVTADSLRHEQSVLHVSKFIKDKLGTNVRWEVPEGIDLNNKIGLSKEGGVLYERMGDKGKPVKAQIVLVREDGVLEYNKSRSIPIARAVKAFKESIGIVSDQSKEMEGIIRNSPMVSGGQAVDGSCLPPGVYDRLDPNDQRELNGVFIDIDRASKMRGRDRHLRVEVNKYLAMRERALETVRHEVNRDKATDLYQEVADYEAVVKAIRDRIELEKTYGEQVKDITRLQRLKAWLKKNVLGLTAVGFAVTSAIASITTAIIIGARTAVTAGAQAVKSFATTVKNAIAKLGPWAVPLAALAYWIIKYGGDAISWIADNLWIIVIAVALFLWWWYRG